MLNQNLSNYTLSKRERRFLEKVYVNESKRMWYTAIKILGNSSQAEDAVQQSFEKIIRNVNRLMSFDIPAYVSKYVLIVVRNTCIDMLRTKKDSIPFHTVDFEISSTENIENIIITEDAIKEIETILAIISPTYADAFYLRHYHSFSYQEISEILEISVSVAHHRVSRCKTLIKEEVCKRNE